ncbi:MAG: hypothetical protein ABIA02_03345 [Candidatus Falkowbacteria bacterium]
MKNTLTPNQQSEVAGQLRQERMKSGVEEKKQEEAKTQKSLRERVASARQAMNLKQKAKDKIAKKITTPARMGTSWLLRSAWMSTTTVLGFIFIGLPYINLHVFGGMVLGEKFFCKLGDEWKPAYKDIAGAFGQMGKAVGVFEILGLVMLDIAVLIIISVNLMLIMIIASFLGAEGLWDKLKWIYEAFSVLGLGIFEVITDLLKT